MDEYTINTLKNEIEKLDDKPTINFIEWAKEHLYSALFLVTGENEGKKIINGQPHALASYLSYCSKVWPDKKFIIVVGEKES